MDSLVLHELYVLDVLDVLENFYLSSHELSLLMSLSWLMKKGIPK
jgi:hypothetical protein